jgi:hypothetical protein
VASGLRRSRPIQPACRREGPADHHRHCRAPPPASAAPAPSDSVGDGVHQVGSDLPAGRCRTDGPSASSVFPNCYDARLKNNSGEFDAIIANGSPDHPLWDPFVSACQPVLLGALNPLGSPHLGSGEGTRPVAMDVELLQLWDTRTLPAATANPAEDGGIG